MQQPEFQTSIERHRLAMTGHVEHHPTGLQATGLLCIEILRNVRQQREGQTGGLLQLGQQVAALLGIHGLQGVMQRHHQPT